MESGVGELQDVVQTLATTVVCRVPKLCAAACLTLGSRSRRALRTMGTKVSTMTREVKVMISDRPTQTSCCLSASLDSRPFYRMGMISGGTLFPTFLTWSPRVRAATCLLS